MSATNITTEQLMQRLQDPALVRAEKNKVQKYVQTELFEKVIFIWDRSVLDVGGKLHSDYMVKCRPLLADGQLTNISDDIRDMYMNLLWSIMTKDESYVAWMTKKRSNTYQGMHDGFMSEYYLSHAS